MTVLELYRILSDLIDKGYGGAFVDLHPDEEYLGEPDLVGLEADETYVTFYGYHPYSPNNFITGNE